MKYLYMGINVDSSNVVLPTTRLIERIKGKKADSKTDSPNISSESSKRKNMFWRYARLVNRLIEEWYRQFLSWTYRKRGFIVIYDRYYSFDFARNNNESDSRFRQRPLDDRLHRWLLNWLYPKPDMVIFLYAPPEVLYARKKEGTIEHLDSLQRTYLKLGQRTKNFFKIDATQLPEKVFNDVSQKIMRFHESASVKWYRVL